MKMSESFTDITFKLLNDNLQGFYNQNPSDGTKIIFGACLDRPAQVSLLKAVRSFMKCHFAKLHIV